ncbi:MAG: ATP-grasp domain-containing protein [Rhodothermaceae bacterium]|nr:ATP-grasp domain-containing protein [Rhodothermaceae bacterium]
MNKTKLTIALSGLNNIDSPGPGIPVIRGLRESEYIEPRIIGLAYDNLEPGAYMHHLVDKSYKVPYPSEGTDVLLDRIRYINRIEHIDILIPNFDSELYAFMKSEGVLKKMGITTFLPRMEQFEERHKANLHQEFISGVEVNVVALGDGSGNTVGAVPMRKQYITDKGKAWGGITLDDPSLLDLTRHIISSTKWRGGMELELIRNENGDLYLIEINPRLPAWTYLAVAAGQNLPEALVRLAIGQSVEPWTDYKTGVMFIRYSYDMITGLDEFEQLSTKGEL